MKSSINQSKSNESKKVEPKSGGKDERSFGTDAVLPFLVFTRQEGEITHYEPWYQVEAEVVKRGYEFTK